MLLFYKFVELYIKAHDYKKYSRYMRLIGIDSTLLKTSIKGSGKYHGTEINGIKIHTSSVLYPYIMPLNISISSANKNDSLFLNELLDKMDDKILYSSILVFDLGYYNLEKFQELKDKNILFVSRIKKNAVYESIGEINNHEIIRFNNGLTLRIVRVNINNMEYDYITSILNLDDKHTAYAYNLRWNIEELFKMMKSQLKMDKLISKSLNGILIQLFSYFIAYIILNMIIDSIGISISFSELIRGIRNKRMYYYNNMIILDLSRI
ncbi:IS4 family transposase [Ferroplasma sp.]|uniref:IS4 family transposase n=1 Tax=Ferroplasma sp. TaxID=2591003 RepID=UPI00307D7B10